MIRIQLGNPLLNNQYGGMAEEFEHCSDGDSVGALLDDEMSFLPKFAWFQWS
jgi:hypothetical protein